MKHRRPTIREIQLRISDLEKVRSYWYRQALSADTEERKMDMTTLANQATSVINELKYLIGEV